jgi:hypothetical protein
MIQLKKEILQAAKAANACQDEYDRALEATSEKEFEFLTKKNLFLSFF